MRTVKQLLDEKGRTVAQVQQDMPIIRCAKELMKRKVGALIVLEGQRLAGIFTYHDLIQTVVERADELYTLPVSQALTPDPVTVPENCELGKIEELMLRKHIHHVPVIRNGDVVGLVDLVDILKRRFEEARVLSSDLEAYIEGVYPR